MTGSEHLTRSACTENLSAAEHLTKHPGALLECVNGALVLSCTMDDLILLSLAISV